MFSQQITGLQQYRVPDWAFAIPFVYNGTVERGQKTAKFRLSLFFLYTYNLFDGRCRSRRLALVIFQPGPLLIICNGFQA